MTDAPSEAVEFTSPKMQLAMLRSWRKRFRELAFITDDMVAALERSIPACPGGRLVTVTLVVTLGSVEKTVKFLWARAAEAQHNSCVWDQIGFSTKDMRLVDHQSFPKGVRWEIVDLGANQGQPPDSVLQGTKRPRPFVVLASAAMHPLWVQAMDGSSVPYVSEASIECTVPGFDPWRFVLDVYFGREARQVRLDAGWRDHANSNWAVPVPPAV